MTGVRDAAREAHENPVLRALARCGFVASGLVHLLVGGIALVLAFGGSGSGDQSGALAAIAGAPAGFVLLWIIAVSLAALALWTLTDAFLARPEGDAGDRARAWGRRATLLGRAIAYGAIGVGSASVAIGARHDPDAAAEGASRDLLHIPGGPIVLGLVGVVIGAVGIGFVATGITRGFRKQMHIPDDAGGRTTVALGVIGYVGEGVALVLVGILLMVAAVKVNPDDAGGTDAALKALVALPAGTVGVGAIGLGLIAFGLFSALRARYDRV